MFIRLPFHKENRFDIFSHKLRKLGVLARTCEHSVFMDIYLFITIKSKPT